MGTWEDIRHPTLGCLEGGGYGAVKAYLERSRGGGPDLLAGKPER